MLVLLAGDTHGNLSHCRAVVRQARLVGAERVIQVGDFGYWPHHPAGAEFLDLLAAGVAAAGLEWWWLDGNHDNHDWLVAEGAFGADEPVPVWGGAFIYLPRGVVTDVGGVTVLSLGGGVSIDREVRVEGESWWAREALTDAEVARASRHSGVDLLLSHDAPDGIVPVVRPGYKDDEDSVAHRRKVSAVVEAVRPSAIVHGHYHHRYDATLTLPDGGLVAVHGLGRDNSVSRSTLLLDTSEASLATVFGR